ncbi:hypothetical protein J6590_032151 [Homalodisca vitripennis]|nr:hypothetical protein J6590_032151 [Homalodisca vitripennis]
MVNGESLEVTDTVITLGVLLDSNLSFTYHVTSVCQRALGRGLYRFRSLLPHAAKLQLVNTLLLTLTCCMVHKTLTLGEPLYLYERLLFLEEVTLLGTRQSNRLHFPKVRHELRRRGFGYFGPGLYNTLPVTLNRCLCLV